MSDHKSIVINSSRELDKDDELIVISDSWAAPAIIRLPKHPCDLEVHRFSDCFSKITPATAVTIDGNGKLICQTELGAPPAGQFPWDGIDPIGPNATFALRYVEFRYSKAAGLWVCTCDRIEIGASAGPTGALGPTGPTGPLPLT